MIINGSNSRLKEHDTNEEAIRGVKDGNPKICKRKLLPHIECSVANSLAALMRK